MEGVMLQEQINTLHILTALPLVLLLELKHGSSTGISAFVSSGIAVPGPQNPLIQ